MIMQLGAEGVFVGSGIFKSENPEKMASAIVEATTNFKDPQVLAKVSRGLGNPMSGTAISELSKEQKIAGRGW
jgi:pyridoxal 5'-phosphate synthase pdxS subunit